MATHPVVYVSWYGAVAFCNWLSEWQGLTKCYDMNTALWPLTVAPPTSGGYRLPTEAEWERAAAWNGTKHWIYGFMSDSNTSGTANRCNDYNSGTADNPLGLTTQPYTSPVGWFNGTNVSPNGSVATVDSPSPVGAYDMSGNACQWCQDLWDGASGYGVGAVTNPIGASGAECVIRGVSWRGIFQSCRSAYRSYKSPTASNNLIGLRLSRSTPSVGVTSFAVNNDDVTTMPLSVTLNNACWGTPTQYMASESAAFTGALWTAYATAPSFTLSFGVGTRTVYLKVRNAGGEVSGVVSDTIFVAPNTVSVGAGTFTMGRTASGDDAAKGLAAEDVQHQVTLSAYQFGKYDITNKEYCDVLNWAKAQGYLYSDAAGTAWSGTGSIYAGGTATSRYSIVSFTSTDCNIQYSGGVFSSKTRIGLPGTTNYSMDTHPMVSVSWYGSVAFCNWLSQWQGLTACYDMSTALWPLTVAPPTSGGYRLPTEAEWERAAAWNGSKHWIYGSMSDTNSGPGSNNRCNDYWYNGSAYAYVNPLGLTAMPYTSPVGWFNGVNVSPNGGVTTVNSPSPVGAYDMSGEVWQWCQDLWDGSTGYGAGPVTNPIGASGSARVFRGGGWNSAFYGCRSAYRNYYFPLYADYSIGFRLCRSN